MTKVGIRGLTGALVSMVLGVGLAQVGLAQVSLLATGPIAQADKRVGILQYSAPASATWGPSAAGPPAFAFGKPAEVLLIVPGGYMVRQELPLEDAIEHATYVSRQIGQPVAVTIPDPAGGPARIEYVGSGDVGK